MTNSFSKLSIMNHSFFSKLVVALTLVAFAAVVIVECASCDPKPKPEKPSTFQSSIWTSKRLEFLITAPDGQEVRMNLPSGARDLQVEFLKDEHFKMELGEQDFFGKYEAVGEERFVTLRPDGKPNFNLEVNRDCKEEKLVLQLSKTESKEIFATLVVQTNPYVPPAMAQLLTEGDVRLRFEFTRKAD
jgi:hypothetical protein